MPITASCGASNAQGNHVERKRTRFSMVADASPFAWRAATKKGPRARAKVHNVRCLRCRSESSYAEENAESTGTTDKRTINSELICAFIQTAIAPALPTVGRCEQRSNDGVQVIEAANFPGDWCAAAYA